MSVILNNNYIYYKSFVLIDKLEDWEIRRGYMVIQERAATYFKLYAPSSTTKETIYWQIIEFK